MYLGLSISMGPSGSKSAGPSHPGTVAGWKAQVNVRHSDYVTYREQWQLEAMSHLDITLSRG